MNITRKRIIQVLSEYFPEEDLDLFEDIADELEEGEETSNSDVSLFIKLLTYYRRRALKHRLVKLNMTHNYPYIDKIIGDVNLFCETFGLGKREGYLKFIWLGIEAMGKSYRIGYFSKVVDKVFDRYEMTLLIDENPHKEVAKDIKDRYILTTIKMSGVRPTLTMEDEKNFAKASKYCADNNIPASVFVDGIFDVLSWRNAIPSTSAFDNPKFLSRIPDYMTKNNLFVKDNVLTLNLKHLKDMRDD